jgi:hypothetical protein
MYTQPPPITTAGVRDMLMSMLDTLSVDPKRNVEELKVQRQAAAATLSALQPRDAIEAELAARTVTAHYAAMDCFRRAALPEVSDEMAIRLRASGSSLSRMAERLMTALERRARAPHGARPAAGGNPVAAAVAAADSWGQHPMPSEPQPDVTPTAGQQARPQPPRPGAGFHAPDPAATPAPEMQSFAPLNPPPASVWEETLATLTRPSPTK